MRRPCLYLPALALALIVTLLAGLGDARGADDTPEPSPGGEASASLPDIEDEVMCPICGTALNLSESPQAERERAFIRRMIGEGRTKEEIKDALVAEYGPEVLATPEASGFDLLAWVVPGAGILAAALGLGFGIRRWRRSIEHGPTSAAAGIEGPDITEDEARRLDSDLARYDI